MVRWETEVSQARGCSFLSCVTLLIPWEDRAGIIFLSISIALYKQDSEISSVNLSVGSSTAVRAEGSFILI